MKKSTLYLIIGFAFLFATLPALYYGAVMGAHFNSFILFPVPCMICVITACVFMHKAEQNL